MVTHAVREMMEPQTFARTERMARPRSPRNLSCHTISGEAFRRGEVHANSSRSTPRRTFWRHVRCDPRRRRAAHHSRPLLGRSEQSRSARDWRQSTAPCVVRGTRIGHSSIGLAGLRSIFPTPSLLSSTNAQSGARPVLLVLRVTLTRVPIVSANASACHTKGTDERLLAFIVVNTPLRPGTVTSLSLHSAPTYASS